MVQMVHLQDIHCKGSFRLLWGGAGEQKLCQFPVQPCPGRQQWPETSLPVPWCNQLLAEAGAALVDLPWLRQELHQRRESSLPKLSQVLFLVVYQVFKPFCECLFLLLEKNINEELALTQITYSIFYS